MVIVEHWDDGKVALRVDHHGHAGPCDVVDRDGHCARVATAATVLDRPFETVNLAASLLDLDRDDLWEVVGPLLGAEPYEP